MESGMLKPDPFPSFDGSDPLPEMFFSAEMVFETGLLRTAFAYWDSLRAGRLMPERSDLRPQDMRAFIANVALTEIVDAPEGQRLYVPRLLGSRVEQVFGTLAERTVEGGLPEAIEARRGLVFARVIESKRPLKVRTKIVYQGKFWIDAEFFVAPLSGEAVPSFLFGALSILEKV
jgi:hypothetical protein